MNRGSARACPGRGYERGKHSNGLSRGWTGVHSSVNRGGPGTGTRLRGVQGQCAVGQSGRRNSWRWHVAKRLLEQVSLSLSLSLSLSFSLLLFPSPFAAQDATIFFPLRAHDVRFQSRHGTAERELVQSPLADPLIVPLTDNRGSIDSCHVFSDPKRGVRGDREFQSRSCLSAPRILKKVARAGKI